MVHVAFSPKLDPDLIEKKAQELEQEERDYVSKTELNKQQYEPVESTREMTKGGKGGGGGVGRAGKPPMASQQPKAMAAVTPQTSNVSKQNSGKEK